MSNLKKTHIPHFLLSLLLFSSPSYCSANESFDLTFCGNKHKNLVILRDLLKESSIAQVPHFIGIPTMRIRTFLEKHAPALFADYKTAVQMIQKTDRDKEIDPSAEKLLKGIQTLIKNSFSEHPFSFTQEEDDLFHSVELEKQFFMVRSTGVEDGAIANAGGNASIAYVLPNKASIKEAIGEVIASYFTLHSLKNRIGGGEIISETDICMPVLIQLLIGEKLGGDSDETKIPVSGVAYTTNQSLSCPSFSITEINAAYGHGEGVVANRVIADRYFITPSATDNQKINIYPMLYEKQDRLVPHSNAEGRTHSLVTHKNSTTLALKSTLSDEQIHKLATVLKNIEAAYGKPMDVEFVIIGSTTYIVQARPAMHVPMKPSYIAFDTLTTEDISSKAYGNLIVPGKAEVVTIADPKDVIITNTLDEADQMANSTQCKIVIVSTWASSLSHAAVNFKTYGTPCVLVSDTEKIKKMLTQVSAEKPLLLDVQQRCLFLWKSSQAKLTQATHYGWLEHPIDRTLSVWLPTMEVTTGNDKRLPIDGKLVHLVQQLKESRDRADQEKLLASITERVMAQGRLTKRRINHFGEFCDKLTAESFDAFTISFENLCTEYTAALKNNADTFQLLFYHKMLEALLFQNEEMQAILGGYSYSSFMENLYRQQVAFMLKKKLGGNLIFGDFF